MNDATSLLRGKGFDRPLDPGIRDAVLTLWTAGEDGEGEVLVFDLVEHPTARKCYAWEVDSEVRVVLHEGPVEGPLAAVRASIVSDHGG